MDGPVALLVDWQSAEQIVEGPVESLTLPVSLRMVGSRTRLGDVVDPAQLLNNGGLKVSALVAVNPLWYPIARKPLSYQHLDHSCRLLVTAWHGHCELGEDISHDEDILLTICGLL